MCKIQLEIILKRPIMEFCYELFGSVPVSTASYLHSPVCEPSQISVKLCHIVAVVRAQNKTSVRAFERAAIGGAFEVATNGVSDMDTIIPPAKINDFRRGQMATDKVELLWTAVGGSMNNGISKAYLACLEYLALETVCYCTVMCGFATSFPCCCCRCYYYCCCCCCCYLY